MLRSNVLEDSVFAMCKRVNTPRSLGFWLRFRYDLAKILEIDWKPSDYLTSDHFARDYLVKSFISKYKGLDLGIDTRAVAVQKFKTSESNCRNVNEVIRTIRSGAASHANPRSPSIALRASRIISGVLGDFRSRKTVSGRLWTNGATVDVPRRESMIDQKISRSPISVSRRASSYLLDDLSHDPHWFESITGILPSGPFSALRSNVCLFDYARLETVPKSSKTDRTILIEPCGNLFLQKGVGSYVRSRLRRVGIDLTDQTYNQDGAKRAYRSGLSTIDLESASDTISIELVALLLPVDWFNYLDDIRSHHYVNKSDGSTSKLEKFSSMGNGFTFELESLIFYALTKAVVDEMEATDKTVLVYGDDIICCNAAARDLVDHLRCFGFTVNTEKSYIEGMFYESCGRHYFGDVEVTPVYQKEDLKTNTDYACLQAHNRLFRWCMSDPLGRADVMASLDVYRRYSRFHQVDQPVHLASQGDFGFLSFDIAPDRLDYAMGRARIKAVVPNRLVIPADSRSLYCYWQRRPKTPFGVSDKTGRSDDLILTTQKYSVKSIWVPWKYSPDLDYIT